MKIQIYNSIQAILFLLCFNFLSNNLALSQSGMPDARNTIYLSFGVIPMGPVSIGLNYERMTSPNTGIRVGVNYTFFYAASPMYIPNAFISFPITMNYITSNNNKFEAGLGGGPIFQVSGLKEKRFPLFPAFNLFYRYQLTRKSMFYKLGLEIPAAPTINMFGIGYHF